MKVKIVDDVCEVAHLYQNGVLICNNKTCPYYPPLEKALQLDDSLIADMAKPSHERCKHDVKEIDCEKMFWSFEV